MYVEPDMHVEPSAELELVGAEGLVQLDPNSSYFPPTSDGIPPFSMSTHRISIKNTTSSAITIEGVDIEPLNDGLNGEWGLTSPGNPSRVDFSLDGTSIPSMQAVELGAHFIPFASGPRQARYTIRYQGGKRASFVIEGRGRDNLSLSPNIKAAGEWVVEHPGADFWVGAAVTDADDSVYFNADPKQITDRFSYDMMLGSLDRAGQLRWFKQWSEDFQQNSPDPGQNAESGGSSNSIAYDDNGAVYVVGNRSPFNSNNWYQAMVLKVSAQDGALQWAKGFSSLTTATPTTSQAIGRTSAEAYAVDASLPDRVIVTGTYYSQILVFALSKDDGRLLFHRLIDPFPGSVDRGYAVKVGADGAGYIAGIGNGRGLLMRMTGLQTNEPQLNWIKRVAFGVGSNINGLDLTPDGDVIASLDTRGATTQLAAARFSKDGQVLWSKVWDKENTGDNNNTYFVNVVGQEVFIGGRIALQPADTQFGDGFVMSLNLADGSWRWGAFYYTGKGTEELSEHRLKAFIPRADGKIWALHQGYTGNNNHGQYWGFWYKANDRTLMLPSGDGSMRLADYPLVPEDLSAMTLFGTLPANEGTATIHDLAALKPMAWRDMPSTLNFKPTEAPKPYPGEAVQGHLLLQVLEPK